MDVVTLPGQNWCCTRSGGYLPLLRDKRAILVYTSANNYCSDRVGQGVQLEFQKPFMRKWLGFIGVEVIGEIVVAPTLTDPDSLGEVLVRAKDRKSVVEGKRVSVRVDHGGRRIIKKKKK